MRGQVEACPTEHSCLHARSGHAASPAWHGWRTLFTQLHWDLLWKDSTDLAQVVFRYACLDPNSVASPSPNDSCTLTKCALCGMLALHAASSLTLPAVHKQSMQTWLRGVCFLLGPHFLECSFVRYVRADKQISSMPLMVWICPLKATEELIAWAHKQPGFPFFACYVFSSSLVFKHLCLFSLVPVWFFHFTG